MNTETMKRPTFIEKLTQLHYGRLSRCVVLTGNIHDLFVLIEKNQIDFLPLEEVLTETLRNVHYLKENTAEQFIIMTLKSDGIHFGSPEDQKRLEAFDKQETFQSLKKRGITPYDALKYLGKFLKEIAEARKMLEKEKPEKYIPPICIIIDQAETIFPNVPIEQMTTTDREIWRYFCDLLRDETIWADAQTADTRPDFIILLSPTMAEINNKIFSLPKVETIEIPLPDETLMKLFVEQRSAALPLYEGLARDARGLTLRTLDDLITAFQRDTEASSLDSKTVIQEVDKRLQIELGGTIKLIRPSHTMKDVVGFRELKSRLQFLADWVNDPERAPAGMTVVGPNGAGKTFIIEAWAAEMGRTVLSLAGGMKSKWYGETEVFLEKFESVLSIYGRVCVIVDEAHKAFGSLHKAETYETEANYARHIIQMISNKKYLSKIFWVLITTRPDMLDPDFVRSGRCSLFVPICDPEGDDAEDFFQWMLRNFKKEGIELSAEDEKLLKEKAQKPDQQFGAGDYQRFINEFIYTRRYCLKMNKDFSLADFVKDWRPSAIRIGRQRKQQILLAAKDCEWRELLPKDYQDMDEEKISQELSNLNLTALFG